MKANEYLRRILVTDRRVRRGAFCVAVVLGVGVLAPYAAPGQAAEPLSCDPIYGNVEVYDARYVASGADCGTIRLTIHSTGLLSNAGTLSNYLSLVNDGGQIANLVDGSMLLFGAFVNEGALDNLGRLEISGYTQGVNNGGLANFGTFTNNSGLFNSGSFTNQDGTFMNQAPLVNNGTLTNGPGSMLASTGIIDNSGTLTNLAGAQLYSNDSFINSGTLTNLGGKINNFSDLQNIGTFTNQLGEIVNFGKLRNLMTLKNGINGTLENHGTLSNQGVLVNQFRGTLTNYSSLSNLRILRNEAGGTLVNYGRLSNAMGATLENGGALTNTIPGRLNNQGRLANAASGVLENRGKLTNGADAALVNQGTLTNAASLSNTGRLTNLGTMTNAMSGTLENTGILRNKEGAHFANMGVLRNDGVVTNAGELVSAGTIFGSGEYRQTGGKMTLDGGLTQRRISIDGGALAGDGWVASNQVMRIAAGALLTPGDETGDVGGIAINAPLDLFGSLDIDIDTLARFDSVTAGSDVAFSPIGSTWFNFYLGNDTSQSEGDSFNFFNGLSFFNFDAVNFRCLGLVSGLGCELNMVNDGRGLQLALNGSSGDGGGGSGGVAVPEPGSLGILCLGFLLLGGFGWRTWRERPNRDVPES